MSFHFQPAFVSLYTAIVQAKLPTASYTVTSTLSKVSIRVEWPLLRTLAVQLDGGKHRTLSHTCRLDILSLRRSTVPPRRTLCLTCSSLHSIIWPYLVFPSSTLNTSSIWSVCVCATGKFLLSQQQQQLCGQRCLFFQGISVCLCPLVTAAGQTNSLYFAQRSAIATDR